MKKTILFLFALFSGAIPAAAQNQKNYKDVDSTLYTYYRWCNNHIRDSVVLLKADTLFRLAGEKNDLRMQAVALSLKADHYYYLNDLDSLKAWIPRVQEFARAHDQLVYYYFTWSRLILHYTKHAQYTMAQDELRRYLARAERDDYKPAIADAYKQLGHIYRTRALNREAMEYYRKAIDYIEQNDLNRFQLSKLYSELASVLTENGLYAEAEEAIEKGKECISLPEYIWTLKSREVILYAKTGRIREAKELFREIQQGHKGYLSDITMLELTQHIRKYAHEYRAAIAATDSLIAFSRRENQNESYYFNYYSDLSEFYSRTGDYKRAFDNLLRYTEIFKKKVSGDNERTLGEFATLLDVERLDREKAELQQQAQEERLRRIYILVTALCITLLLAGGFIFVLSRLNRRLAHAKRAAEESNRMKGVFIRTITHEINTPLNAIVGFAELAATAPDSDPERRSYLEIVQTNSTNLQKIVDDALYISDLESTEQSPRMAPVDINTCCRQCVAAASGYLHEGVTIHFLPGCDDLTVRTSQLYLTKALTELLQNAARFTPQGTITFDYAVTAEELAFRITDTGPGIPAGEHEHVFERFVKLDSFSQGMGLGLAVCRMLAHALRGTVTLDTAYTAGARFLLTIPLNPETRRGKSAAKK